MSKSPKRIRLNENQPRALTDNEKSEQLRRVLLNSALSIVTSRLTYGNTKTFGGLRDVYEALGYPGLDRIGFEDFYFRFRRQDVAGKIVEKPVEGSWRKPPIIRAVDDANDKWKDEFDALNRRLGLLPALYRWDLLSGIGRYGCLLVGYVDNAPDFTTPVEGQVRDIAYLQPFTEGTANIKDFVQDKNDPRYGLVKNYGLRLASVPNTAATHETVCHHSRIFHLVENPLESAVYGQPRLERAWNRLLNLELIVGGSAEMFWQGAFPGMAFKAQEDFNITPEIKAELEEEIQKYVHKIERYMKLQGIDVESLSPVVADPSSHVEVQLKMISIATGIPKRILEGSERGELASSQDSESWDGQCDHRRVTHVEPNIIRPVVDDFIAKGILSEPKNGYELEWPDLSTPSEKEQADVGKVRAESIVKYLDSPSAGSVLPLDAFLEDIMGMDYDGVWRIMEKVERHLGQIEAEGDGEGDDEAEEVMDDENNTEDGE